MVFEVPNDEGFRGIRHTHELKEGEERETYAMPLLYLPQCVPTPLPTRKESQVHQASHMHMEYPTQLIDNVLPQRHLRRSVYIFKIRPFSASPKSGSNNKRKGACHRISRPTEERHCDRKDQTKGISPGILKRRMRLQQLQQQQVAEHAGDCGDGGYFLGIMHELNKQPACYVHRYIIGRARGYFLCGVNRTPTHCLPA